MLVLCIETMFVNLTSKTSQEAKTCDLVLLTISSLQTFSYIPKHYYATQDTSLNTLKHSQIPLSLKLHKTSIFVSFLTLNFNLQNHSCVSWLNTSKSFLASYTNHTNTCLQTVTPFIPSSITKNRGLHLYFSIPFQPSSAQASHCISFLGSKEANLIITTA